MKNNIFRKIVKSSSRPAWQQENREVKRAAIQQTITDAYVIHSEMEHMRLCEEYSYSGIEFNGKIKEALIEILKEYNQELDEIDPYFGKTLFNEAFKDLEDLVNEFGDEVTLVDEKAKEKLEVIFDYYPKYSWLKSNFMKIKKGREIFDAVSVETQEAFQAAKIQGRFKWNIQ